jgi:hypothetical protein
MAGPRGSGSKRGGPSTTLNGHTNHSLTKKRSQRFDSSPTLGGRRNSIDLDIHKSGSGDSTPERDLDARAPPGSSTSNSSASITKDPAYLTNSLISGSQKRIHVGPSSSPTVAAKDLSRLSYASVLPPHQYLDSLAITFFLVNLPTILLVVIHLLFVVFAVSSYPTTTDRFSSWKTILPAEAFIVLFFALVSPSIRAYITELAEPVIASTLVGNGGRGTAICAAVMFAAGRVPNVVFGGLIRLKRFSPGSLRDGIALTANDLETEMEALDRLGDELQAWVLALIRQLIAIHVVARWSWEGLKTYLTNRINQRKLEDASASSSVETAALNKRKKTPNSPQPSSLSRMPLWTTIANNYIIATKDTELKPPEDLPTFMFENECALHVRNITSSSVRLCAKGPRHKLASCLGPFDSFDVCVNGLQWREISISLHDDRTNDETLYHQEFVCLYLDIQALVPSTANEIEVTNTNLPDPGTLLFHATICTIQKEATAAAPILAPQTVRPSSPISTLTDKVNNAIDNLNELKNNQRRIRKDHKATISSLRAEMDTLHSRLEAPDKGEERARRGNLALKYHIMQTEDKIRKIEEDIQVAEVSIASCQEQLLSGREKWETEQSALENSRRSQNATKYSYDKFLQQFHSEKMAVNGRKEKLMSREVKLKGELDILEAAERKKHEESDDRAKKRQEARNQLIKDRQASQAKQIIALEHMESHLADIKERTARTHAERLVLESSPVLLQQSNIVSGSPATSPEMSVLRDSLRKDDDSPERLGISGE